MPFWKWWAGEFTSPMERFQQATGITVQRVGRPKEMMTVEEAKQQDGELHDMYADLLGVTPLWDSTVRGTFSEQFGYNALHSTRAYAAFLDHPPRTGPRHHCPRRT